MKILHIVQTYMPAYRYGGPIRSVHELNKWLVKKGEEVTVYTTNINGPDDLDVPVNQPVDVDGVRVFYFKNSFPRCWFYSKYLRKALKENAKDFDIIHSTGAFLMAAALGAHYSKKFNKPFVISPRGSLMEQPLNKKSFFKKKLYIALIEKRNLRQASAVHFTAALEKEEYLRNNLPLNKAIIIPNGLDFEKINTATPAGLFRKQFNIPPDKKIVLFLGRLSWKKGFDTLIPAFSDIIKESPGAVLVLAGVDDEKYKKVIERMIKDYSLSDKVVFAGSVNSDNEAIIFRDAQIFVLPSYSENFALSVLQAMYFGLPVIVTDSVGVAPYVEEAKAGIVIKKDRAQLVAAMQRLLKSDILAKEMGDRGRKLTEENFSWEKIADRFIKEYGEVIVKNAH